MKIKVEGCQKFINIYDVQEVLFPNTHPLKIMLYFFFSDNVLLQPGGLLHISSSAVGYAKVCTLFLAQNFEMDFICHRVDSFESVRVVLFTLRRQGSQSPSSHLISFCQWSIDGVAGVWIVVEI